MTANVNLINGYTIDEYATLAFSLSPSSATGFGAGGVFTGPIDKAAGAKPWHSQFTSPNNSTARARFIQVPPGKIFVRWARMRDRDWKVAASGPWWVSDNMADFIVRKTSELYGGHGETGPIARQYSQVLPSWNDMGTVVVCKTTQSVKVLAGIGRPVAGVPTPVAGMPDGIQVIMLTTIISPKDPSRRRFIGDQYLQNLWIGSSRDFTTWWLKQHFISKRRVAQRVARTGK